MPQRSIWDEVESGAGPGPAPAQNPWDTAEREFLAQFPKFIHGGDIPPGPIAREGGTYPKPEFALGGEIPEAEVKPYTQLPFAGAYGYQPPTGPPQGWQGPEPEGAQPIREFLGRSLLFPNMRDKMAANVEKQRSGELDPRWLPPETPVSTLPFAGNVAYPKRDPGPIGVQAEAVQGGMRFVEELTNPVNLGLGAGIIASGGGVLAVPAARIALQLGMGIPAVKHAIEQYPQLREDYENEDWGAFTEHLVEAGGSLALGTMMLKHGASGIRQGIVDPLMGPGRYRAARAEYDAKYPPPKQLRQPEADIIIEAREVAAEPTITPEPGVTPKPRRKVKGPAVEEPVVEPEVTGIQRLADELKTAQAKLKKTAKESKARVEAEAAAIAGQSDAQGYVNDLAETPGVSGDLSTYAQDFLDWRLTGEDTATMPPWEHGEGKIKARNVRKKINGFLKIDVVGELPTEVTPPRKTKLDEATVELDEAIEAGPSLTGNLGADRQAIAKFYEAIYAENVRLMKAGKIPPEEAVLKNQLNTQRWDAALAKLETTPPRKEPMVDVEAEAPTDLEARDTELEELPIPATPGGRSLKKSPLKADQRVLAFEHGMGLITDVVGDMVNVKYDNGVELLVPKDEALAQRKAADVEILRSMKGQLKAEAKEEFPERVGIKLEEPTVAPEPGETVAPKGTGKIKGLTAESLSSGDTVWFKGEKKATIIGLSADGKKAVILWDGGGQRTVLMNNLTLESRVGAPKDKPEKKIGLRPGQKETIELGQDRHTIEIERDDEGNIIARVLSMGKPTAYSSNWIEIKKGKAGGLAAARRNAFLDAKETFIAKELRIATKRATGVTSREQLRSEYWDKSGDFMLWMEPDSVGPRPQIVAKVEHPSGDGLTWEYAVRPDVIEGKMGWLPVVRTAEDKVWTSAGWGRLTSLSEGSYDSAVERIQERIPDGATFYDDVAIELQRKQEAEAAAVVTAEETERTTTLEKRKNERQEAEAKTEVSRQEFKAIPVTGKPPFVAAVQHRAVLKKAPEGSAITVVKDGVAITAGLNATVMTRTDLKDGYYTPFVKGDNKAFRKQSLDAEALEKKFDPIGAEGKDGIITIGPAIINDLKRMARVITSEESRYALSGAQIKRAGKGQLEIAATDGHRLVVNRIPYEGELKGKGPWMLGKESLDLILKDKGNDRIKLILDPGVVTMAGPHIAISQAVQGSFPKYDMIMADVQLELVLNKKELVAALQKARIEMLESDVPIVAFNRTDQGIEIIVEFDTIAKLDEIAVTYQPGETPKAKKLERGKEVELELVPRYGSVGTVSFTQRSPGRTKRKSEITVQMPIKWDGVGAPPADFAYNLDYVNDILAGIKGEGVGIGLTSDPAGEQTAWTGLSEGPKKTKITYTPPEPILAGKETTKVLKAMVRSDEKKLGYAGPKTVYALDYADFLEKKVTVEPVADPVVSLEDGDKKIREIIDAAWAKDHPQGSTGAMAGRKKQEFTPEQKKKWRDTYRGKNIEAIRAKARAKYREKTEGIAGEGWEPAEPIVKQEGAPTQKQKQLRLQDLEDEALQLQVGDVSTLGEGAMAGRTNRPGPPGRKPAPPLPPKPPAPPSGEPPEPPGEALQAAEKMAAGREPEKVNPIKLMRAIPLKLQALLTSEFQPLKHAQDRIYEELGLELPSVNLARRFELQAGAHGKGRLDVLEFDEQVVDLITKGNGSDFETYVVLERIRDRLMDNPEVKKVGKWTIERADRAIREQRGKLGEMEAEFIREIAHNEYQEVVDRALRLQVTSERMSEEDYTLMKKHNPFYAPFKILQLIESEGLAGTGRAMADVSKYTRAITGIDDDDVIFERVLQVTRELIYRSRILAEKNMKMLELHKIMELGGSSNPFKKANPDRFFQIHYKPAEDILHQLAMQQTARTPQLLEHSLMKVGRAIELADQVGIKLKKRNLRASLGRATLGGAEGGGYVNLMAFTSDVIAHEFGHSFDVPIRDKNGKIITKERKVFGVERDIVQRLSTVINTRKGVKFGQKGTFQKELAELVKHSKLGGSDKYRAKATERFAEFVNMYIHDPKTARRLAPQWTDYFEKELLPQPKMKLLIERLAGFFQKADKLPNIMDDLKDMGGFKYIELAVKRAFPERKPQMGIRFGTKPPKGQEILLYFKDGKKAAMMVPKDIAHAVQGLEREEGSTIARWLNYGSTPLRLGATAYNVRFQFRNLLAADLPRAALVSRYGIQNMGADLPRFMGDWLYALYSSFKLNFGTPNELGRNFLRSGASNSTISSALQPDTFDPTIERGWALSVLDTIPKISQAIEETSKLLGIRRAWRIEGIEDMPPEKALELIDYIAVEIRNYSGSPDFPRGGQMLVGPHMENLNILFVFLRARINGQTADAARLIGRTGTKERNMAWARLTPLMVAMTTAALYNRLSGNRDDYNKRAQWEIDNYFMFPRSNKDGSPLMIVNENGEQIRAYWRWPKREITQLLGNFIDAAVKFADERDPDALRDFAVSFLENISPVSVSGKDMQERVESIVSNLNPVFKVPIEYGLGRDTFRHRYVVPTYIQGVPSRNLSPSQQYTSTTPDIFIKLGQVSGISPMIIEQLVRGASAGLITQFIPRKRPGRSKLLELPLIGPVLDSLVGSEYLATEADEDLQVAEVRSGDRKVNINRKSEDIYKSWNLTDQKGSLVEFIKQFGGEKEHHEKVLGIIEDVRLGLTYTERRIKQLPVGDGTRAAYLAGKMLDMDTKERETYIVDYRRKRIVTDIVSGQIGRELRILREQPVQSEAR